MDHSFHFVYVVIVSIISKKLLIRVILESEEDQNQNNIHTFVSIIVARNSEGFLQTLDMTGHIKHCVFYEFQFDHKKHSFCIWRMCCDGSHLSTTVLQRFVREISILK